MNPYLDSRAVIDYAYNLPSIKAILYFHPDEEIAFSAGFNFASTNRMPIFINSDSSVFGINYAKVNSLEGFVEGILKLTRQDNFVANITINHSAISSSGKIQPYTSPLNLTLDYNRKWDESFGTQIGMVYISERFTDLANNNKLPSSFNLKFKVDYWFKNNLKIFADFENLLNSDMFVWNGYKERGLFLSGGILWQF
jgi:outer membrane cobalamin receptor